MLAQLLAALPELEKGDLDPRRATAMAALAGAIVKVFGAGTLEERLSALETAQAEGKAG